MRRVALVIAVAAMAGMLGGCAAGAATAGYSVRAKSADEVSPTARSSIVDEARRYTDDQIARLRAELTAGR